MGAIHGRGTEYGKAYREHQAVTEELRKARLQVMELEESHKKSELRLNSARRVLLEEAQQA